MITKARVALFTVLAIIAFIPCLVTFRNARTQRYSTAVYAALDAAANTDAQFYRNTPRQISANQLTANLCRQANAIAEIEKRLDGFWYPSSMADIHTAMTNALRAHRQAYTTMTDWVQVKPGNPAMVMRYLQTARENYRTVSVRVHHSQRSIISLTNGTVTGINAMGERWDAKRHWCHRTQAFLAEIDEILHEYNADHGNLQVWLAQLSHGTIDQELIDALDERMHCHVELARRTRNLDAPDCGKSLRDSMAAIITESAREFRYYSKYAKDRFMYEDVQYSWYGDYGLYGYEGLSPRPPDQALLASGKKIAIANVKAVTNCCKIVESLRVASKMDANETKLHVRW